MPGRTGDPNGCRCHAVLQDFFANKISSPEAATKLAAAALPANSSASTVAERLSYLWQLIVKTACENRDYQVKLVDVLIDLSRLPDITKPNDEKGQSESLLVEGGRVWKDLPLLGPTVRDWWNLDIDPDTAPQERQKTTDMVVNLSRFTALLLVTADEPSQQGTHGSRGWRSVKE